MFCVRYCSGTDADQILLIIVPNLQYIIFKHIKKLYIIQNIHTIESRNGEDSLSCLCTENRYYFFGLFHVEYRNELAQL